MQDPPLSPETHRTARSRAPQQHYPPKRAISAFSEEIAATISCSFHILLFLAQKVAKRFKECFEIATFEEFYVGVKNILRCDTENKNMSHLKIF